MLLIDRQSAVDAVVQRSRARGIVRGAGDGLVFEFVGARRATSQPGDVLVTSGLGGVYPEGPAHRRGRRGVGADATMLQRDAEVRPAVDFGRLEQVFVMLRRGPTMELLYATEGGDSPERRREGTAREARRRDLAARRSAIPIAPGRARALPAARRCAPTCALLLVFALSAVAGATPRRGCVLAAGCGFVVRPASRARCSASTRCSRVLAFGAARALTVHVNMHGALAADGRSRPRSRRCTRSAIGGADRLLLARRGALAAAASASSCRASRSTRSSRPSRVAVVSRAARGVLGEDAGRRVLRLEPRSWSP